jgi:hypothetical protein
MNKYRYITYRGRDRDDWTEHFIYAEHLALAKDLARNKWLGTSQTVKTTSFKVVDNQ